MLSREDPRIKREKGWGNGEKTIGEILICVYILPKPNQFSLYLKNGEHQVWPESQFSFHTKEEDQLHNTWGPLLNEIAGHLSKNY